MNIRQVKTNDANMIIDIYNWYILNTTITFKTKPVTLKEMGNRISNKLSDYDWLVGEIDI